MRKILKQGLSKEISSASTWSKLALGFFPLLHLALAVGCTYLSIFEVSLLGYTVGAFCVMSIFSNAHDLSHGVFNDTVGRRTARSLLLRIVTLIDINPSFYFYYKYGHEAHHANQGGLRAKNLAPHIFDKTADLDPMTHLKNIYMFKASEEDAPRYRFPAIEQNRALRWAVLFGMPLLDALLDFTLSPISLLLNYRTQHPTFQRKMLNDLMIQTVLTLLLFTMLIMGTGNINFLLYLLLSRAFVLGFIHPYGLLWVAIHYPRESTYERNVTASVGGRLTSFFCAGINLHVEHHDLPWVPHRELWKVRTLYPELYRETHFSNLWEIAKIISKKHYRNVYAPDLI